MWFKDVEEDIEGVNLSPQDVYCRLEEDGAGACTASEGDEARTVFLERGEGGGGEVLADVVEDVVIPAGEDIGGRKPGRAERGRGLSQRRGRRHGGGVGRRIYDRDRDVVGG